MYLYVLRHGKAEDAYPDEIRELTESGRNDLQAVLTNCSKDVESLDHIISSPLIRAQQTANMAADVLGHKGSIVESEDITPWGSPQAFLDSMDDQCNAVLIVSHQPYVSILVEYLTGRSIAMPTAAIAAVKIDYPSEGGGELLWYRTA